MSETRQALVHLAALAVLVFLLGFDIYSLSIDVAHHFMLVDFLAHEDPATLPASPWMESMAIYPPGSHWLAAGLGMVIGSNYAAMWVLCIVAIYAGYFFLGRILQGGRGYVAVVLFFLLFLLARPAGAVLGREIVINFFYSQLICAAFFFAILFVCGRIGRRNELAVALVGLAGASFLMWMHLLPGLYLIGAVGLFLLLEAGDDFRQGKPYLKRLAGVAVFGIAGVAVILLHPSFAAMREISANNGALEFPLNPWLLYAIALILVAVSGWSIIWSQRHERTAFDEILVAAAVAAVALMTVQLLSLLILGEGSPYAVKKHLFLVITLALACSARALSGLLTAETAGRQTNPLPTIAMAAVATWLVYPEQSILPMRGVTVPLEYAQHAVRYGFPSFEAGNTAMLAESVDPVTRYMINSGVFRVPFQTALAQLFHDIGQPSTAPEFAFLVEDQTVTELAGCNERYAETSRYVVVASGCVGSAGPGTVLSHRDNAIVTFDGWSVPEETHRWSDGDESRITLQLAPAAADQCLALNGFTLGPQRITASIGGRIAAETRLEGRGTMMVPLGRAEGPTEVTLRFSDPHVPSEADSRILAFAVETMAVGPCP
ncbi:hypothetical protein [Aurantimonas sp. HBX-1]|uniref:hypothetical protein n=1 Tax=Aurantimonas sp. HBX-1 TaxID=2906072 RepID=UPI001F28B642|nr:hypothetical protein [Aurantimonas sp. HBX-1]UIJ71072.1 hypothetical protein LXB15_15270 [Aurantimonas sp. HBX-1]